MRTLGMGSLLAVYPCMTTLPQFSGWCQGKSIEHRNKAVLQLAVNGSSLLGWHIAPFFPKEWHSGIEVKKGRYLSLLNVCLSVDANESCCASAARGVIWKMTLRKEVLWRKSA